MLIVLLRVLACMETKLGQKHLGSIPSKIASNDHYSRPPGGIWFSSPGHIFQISLRKWILDKED